MNKIKKLVTIYTERTDHMIKDIYNSLSLQKNQYSKKLQEKKAQLQEINEEKCNIIIKRIHGELYYYVQYRDDGKVKSKYVAPVKPGRIADLENNQEYIRQLNQEIKELEWNIESLNKMMQCYEKRKKKEVIMDDFTFEVYWKDEITARVYVKKKNVTISRYTDNPGKQLFAQTKMTRYQLGKIFEMRCWEKERSDINEILEYLDLSEYNPYEIVKRTHGVSYNDFIWFRFPGEKLTSKDVLVR